MRPVGTGTSREDRVDLELEGRVAVVIGGSSGIGASLAAVLAEEGCDVAVTYRSSPAGAEQAADVVRGQGRRAWVAALDLGEHETVGEAAHSLAAMVGGVDVLVICAGHNVVTSFRQITPAEWGTVLDVNLTGAFLAVQAMAPALRPGGSVVTVSSVAAHTGAPHHMHYAAAKAGLENLTRSLARALAPHVRVNCVAPGITLTAMGQETIDNLPEDYARRSLLLERYATPRRVAQVIAFVASPVNEYMTGATVDVNSGRAMR